MIKKGFQIGFAFSLIILSVICTIWKNDVLEGVVYAVVIPSFILSIISFVLEISDNCRNYSEKITSLAKEKMKISDQLYELDVKTYMASSEYVEGYIPTELADKHTSEKTEYATNILSSQDVTIFFLRCRRICSVIAIIGYVLLVLSLTLSFYVVKLLSVIDLNCITLWSTTLLYFTLELKSEICDLLFKLLYNMFLKKNQRIVDKELESVRKQVKDSEIKR